MKPNPLENPKYHTLEGAVAYRERCRSEGKRVVLTNGVFDLLHTGHLYFLSTARALGEVLFVAINNDAGVKELKGPSRPVQSEAERAYALSALDCVDAVLVFDRKRLVREIEAIKPDLYAKAGDYTIETLDPGERTALEATGSDIRFVPFLEGYSTTELIRRIRAAAGTF